MSLKLCLLTQMVVLYRWKCNSKKVLCQLSNPLPPQLESRRAKERKVGSYFWTMQCCQHDDAKHKSDICLPKAQSTNFLIDFSIDFQICKQRRWRNDVSKINLPHNDMRTIKRYPNSLISNDSHCDWHIKAHRFFYNVNKPI